MKSIGQFFNSYRRAFLSLSVLVGIVVVGGIANHTSANLRDIQSGNSQNENSSNPVSERAFRAVSTNGAPGGEVTVSLELDSMGDEVAASFTINFDPAVLNTPVLSLGTDAPAGTALTVNANQATSGRVGLLIDSANSFVFSPPARQALRVKFSVAPGAPSGPTMVTFGSAPTPRSTSSPFGDLLPTTYQSGTISIGAAAPMVTVGGRVSTPTGLGLRNAVVTITDSNNVKRTATTSSFGLYSFPNVQSGQTYTLSVASKRYRFAAQVVSVSNDISNLDFIGLE